MKQADTTFRMYSFAEAAEHFGISQNAIQHQFYYYLGKHDSQYSTKIKGKRFFTQLGWEKLQMLNKDVKLATPTAPKLAVKKTVKKNDEDEIIDFAEMVIAQRRLCVSLQNQVSELTAAINKITAIIMEVNHA